MIRATALAAALALSAPALAAEPKWWCDGDNCFDAATVTTDGNGRLAVFAADKSSDDKGWVAIDCVLMLAAVPGYETQVKRGSSLDRACDRWAR